jgi:hypothetical protein
MEALFAKRLIPLQAIAYPIGTGNYFAKRMVAFLEID